MNVDKVTWSWPWHTDRAQMCDLWPRDTVIACFTAWKLVGNVGKSHLRDSVLSMQTKPLSRCQTFARWNDDKREVWDEKIYLGVRPQKHSVQSINTSRQLYQRHQQLLPWDSERDEQTWTLLVITSERTVCGWVITGYHGFFPGSSASCWNWFCKNDNRTEVLMLTSQPTRVHLQWNRKRTVEKKDRKKRKENETVTHIKMLVMFTGIKILKTWRWVEIVFRKQET